MKIYVDKRIHYVFITLTKCIYFIVMQSPEKTYNLFWRNINSKKSIKYAGSHWNKNTLILWYILLFVVVGSGVHSPGFKGYSNAISLVLSLISPHGVFLWSALVILNTGIWFGLRYRMSEHYLNKFYYNLNLLLVCRTKLICNCN